MRSEVRHDSRLFRALTRSLLTNGFAVRFRAEGRSMFPAIADGDTVELKPASSIRKGEVVLVATEDGLRTHRIINETDCRVLTQGDACLQPDKPIDRSSVIGRVTRVITVRPRTLRSSLRALFRRIA